jgi:GTPase involved in cell partitioning and DNA repair
MMVVATKLDVTMDRTKLDELRVYCAKNKFEFHAVSAATGEGISEVVYAIADALDRLPRVTVAEADAEWDWDKAPSASTGHEDV